MVNINDLRDKYNQINNPQSNADFLDKFLMMDEGTTSVRILPWKDGNKDFYAETAIHRINDKNYHCPKIEGKPCPMCDLNHRLWQTKNDANIEIARSIKSRKRFYMNVIDRRDGKVKILSMGIKLFSKILDAFLDEDYGDLTDLKEGWDFKIVKKKNGPWPDYDSSAPRPNTLPAGTDSEVATWMDELHEIHDMVEVADYDELKELALGITGENTNQGSPAKQDSEEANPVDSMGEDDDYLSHLKSLKT